MEREPSARRRIFNDARRDLEARQLALRMLLTRLEPSIEAGEWLLAPADVREDYERARRALGS